MLSGAYDELQFIDYDTFYWEFDFLFSFFWGNN